MKHTYHAAAIDLGASGGRIILGEYDGTSLEFTDEYRMDNSFINWNGSLYWDVLRLYQDIIRGFRYYHKKGIAIDSVGINTWGVDFVLLDRDGQPAAFPRCYRDSRNYQAYGAVSEILKPRDFYELTGIMPDAINSVYQLYAASGCAAWKNVDTFLFMPDFFCYLMTGTMATETSVASTSQLLDRRTGEFHRGILARLGLDGLRLPEILKKPMVRGVFHSSFSEQTGYGQVRVMNINSHDTGSAISLAESLPEGELLMNCGTIAILSSIREQPFVSEESYQCGITNESVLGGRFRPAVNLSGLFFINQCRDWWRLEGKEYSWTDITDLAARSEAYLGRIDITDPELLKGGNMPRLIREQCRNRGVHIPRDDGETARMVYETIAEAFAESIRKYERAAGHSYSRLNLVGGGSRNRLLSQMIADASGKPVRTGPQEATAMGNVLTQLEGAGELNHEESLEIMRKTFSGEVLEPQIRKK